MAKTNKTDHVLNLLSKGKNSEGPKDAPPVELATNRKKTTETEPNKESQANISVVDEKKEETDSEMADLIKSSLENEFEEKKNDEEDKVEEEENRTDSSVETEMIEGKNIESVNTLENEEIEQAEENLEPEETVQAEENLEQEETVQAEENLEQEETVQAEENLEQEKTEQPKEPEKSENDAYVFCNPAMKERYAKKEHEGLIKGEDPDVPYKMLNVMEALVDKRIVEYMQEFEMCTCHRCMVDVKALALTNLSPKYIVAKKGAVSPILNYYEKKYEGDVIVELTRACIVVKEDPHH